MKRHFLDEIPSEKRWIVAPGVPVVENRGTRLITYVNLRQIRIFEKDAGNRAVKIVKNELRSRGLSSKLDTEQEAKLRRGENLYNAIKHVTLDTVENIPALLQLRQAMLQPGTDINEAILATDSIPYVSVILAQVGGRIKSATVSGGDDTTVGRLMKHYEARASHRLRPEVIKRHEQLLVKYGVSRATVIHASFNVRLEIEPLSKDSNS